MEEEVILFSSPVEIHKRVKKKDLIINDCNVQIINASPFVYKLLIIDSNSEPYISCDIISVLSPQFSLITFTFCFSINFSKKTHVINLVFNNKKDINNFVNIFCNSLFEEQNKSQVLDEDLPQIKQFITSICIDQKEEEEEEVEEEEEEKLQKDSHQRPHLSDGGHNFLLRIAPKTKSSVVMRKCNDHCNLDFFTNDSSCQFMMTIPNISDKNGLMISATDMLTNNSDHGLLVLDQNRPTEIFDMNLDRGIVVEHYNAIDSQNMSHPISHIMHAIQNDSTQPIFIGFNNKNTIQFDTRVKNSIVNRSDYKGNNQFISGITTKNGRVAMGSVDGIVRLYRKPCLTRATVNFHVGNEPITAIDISPNEDWIVATSPNYLSIFTVLSQSTKKLGFDFPMKDSKSNVIKLVISQKDQQIIARINNGQSLPFTSAKFELGPNKKIYAVIASIGNALVSWDFASIMNGIIPKYLINFISNELIIDNQPLNSAEILYMSKNRVSVTKMKNNDNENDSDNDNDSDD